MVLRRPTRRRGWLLGLAIFLVFLASGFPWNTEALIEDNGGATRQEDQSPEDAQDQLTGMHSLQTTAQAQDDANDPPPTAYGSEYSADVLTEKDREETHRVKEETDPDPDTCRALIDTFVSKQMGKLEKETRELEALDKMQREPESEDILAQAVRRVRVGGPEHMHHLRHMMFFLHVPRTGGRTYHQCFLKALFPVERRCPRSYDALRFNLHVPACRLLATHNDYSLMERLPVLNVSVITNMRNPVDRIISAYEFALETAARSLRWVVKRRQGESTTEARRRVRSRMGHGPRTETRNVWPWSLLIPMLEDDLWARREQSKPAQGAPRSERQNSYEKSHLVMPLDEFVAHPKAVDLLHNGATFHILGITQNSVLKEAPLLRSCAIRHPETATPLLKLAKARLDEMLHIGLTEVHKESAVLLAAAMGLSLYSPAKTGPDLRVLAMSHRGKENEGEEFQARLARLKKVYSRRRGATLIDHYNKCVAQQRRRYVARRRAGLRLLGPGVNFSHEARGSISPSTLDRIRDLNTLDTELFQYARERFELQRTFLAARVKVINKQEERMKARREKAAQFAEASKSNGAHASLDGERVKGRRRLLSFEDEGLLDGVLRKYSYGTQGVTSQGRDGSFHPSERLENDDANQRWSRVERWQVLGIRNATKHRDDYRRGRLGSPPGVDCRSLGSPDSNRSSELQVLSTSVLEKGLCCPLTVLPHSDDRQ